MRIVLAWTALGCMLAACSTLLGENLSSGGGRDGPADGGAEAAAIAPAPPPPPAASDGGPDGGPPDCRTSPVCEVFADGLDEPRAIVARPDVVYWVERGANGASVQLRRGDDGYAVSAVDAAPGRVQLRAVDDGVWISTGEALAYYRTLDPPTACGFKAASTTFAVVGTFAYLAEAQGIVRYRCGNQPVTFLDSLQVEELEADTAALWWAGSSNQLTFAEVSGGGARLAGVGVNGHRLRVGATHAFWVEGDDVYAHPKAADAGTKRRIAKSPGAIGEVYADGDTVYFTDVDNGTVARARPTSDPNAPLDLIAGGLRAPSGIAVAGGLLYVVETGAGRIVTIDVAP